MKRIISLFALLLLLPCASLAQHIDMDSAYLTFEYPDEWLVLSPQWAKIYAPLLEDAGIDADALSQEMDAQGVLSRAYSADFSECLSVLVRSDELSDEIFDIERVTDSQRRTLKSRAEAGSLWETTGLRAQDVEWQKENGVYWLYIHYTITSAEEIIGRGLRYLTVRNGMYVMIDWQISGRRFGNKDLAAFRARIADLTVTKTLEEPVRPVTLTAEIPTETSTADMTISGKATPGATLLVTAPDAYGEVQTLSVGEVGTSGSFTLLVPLEEEGTYDLTLTASYEGMTDTSTYGTVIYSAKTLPVSGIVESLVVTEDTTVISGTTLSAVQIQLVTPFGLTKKKSGSDGSFSFELTTAEAGDYAYTLIFDKSGYNQRRVQFNITRVVTDEQERAAIRSSAERISYKNLQMNREQDQGKTMSLYGPVTQVSQAGDQYYVRLQFNKDAKGVWYNPVIIVANEDMGVKEGDMLTVVVTVAGVYEEQDEQGKPVMVPRFELQFVDKIE